MTARSASRAVVEMNRPRMGHARGRTAPTGSAAREGTPGSSEGVT